MYLAYICFAIALLGLLLIIYTAIKSKPSNPHYRRHRRDKPVAKQSVRNNHPNYKRLLNMVGGDRVAADNLADTYGVDKAIDDLIRDRR